MTTRRVSWRRSDEVRADEQCTISFRDAGLSLVGTVLGAEGGVPFRTEYRVLTDGTGATSAVHVRDLRGFTQRTLTLARDPKGAWTVDGVADKALRGCHDIDLGCSPSTNTLPIRRLRLGVGGSKTIQAAWVRFPELRVEKSRRRTPGSTSSPTATRAARSRRSSWSTTTAWSLGTPSGSGPAWPAVRTTRSRSTRGRNAGAAPDLSHARCIPAPFARGGTPAPCTLLPTGPEPR